ncbi:hypothetical protein D3C80_992840 [compost metagenome]
MSRHTIVGPDMPIHTKTDGTKVNIADGINTDGSQNTRTIGSNVVDYGPVTPSDSVNLTKPAIAIAIAGTAGSITVIKPNGEEVTIPAALLPLGQFIPFPAIRIKATGTTATSIWAMY